MLYTPHRNVATLLPGRDLTREPLRVCTPWQRDCKSGSTSGYIKVGRSRGLLVYARGFATSPTPLRASIVHGHTVCKHGTSSTVAQ